MIGWPKYIKKGTSCFFFQLKLMDMTEVDLKTAHASELMKCRLDPQNSLMLLSTLKTLPGLSIRSQ